MEGFEPLMAHFQNQSTNGIDKKTNKRTIIYVSIRDLQHDSCIFAQFYMSVTPCTKKEKHSEVISRDKVHRTLFLTLFGIRSN